MAVPRAAQADKGSNFVAFKSASHALNVAAFYETTPATQKDIAIGLVKSTKNLIKKAPGFMGYSILKRQDGSNVMTLSQWRDLASYDAFSQQLLFGSLPGTGSAQASKWDEAVTVAPAPTRTAFFEIDQTQSPEGVTASLRGIGNIVQFSEVIATAPTAQPGLLASAETLLQEIPQMYPAPRSAVVLKGTEGTEVAFLADWGYSRSEVEDLSKIPALNFPEAAIDQGANFYEVVKIIAAKPPKPVKEKPKSMED